jgi:division protein CdvB (Snf7/Vps24/ESCRT-III family)
MKNMLILAESETIANFKESSKEISEKVTETQSIDSSAIRKSICRLRREQCKLEQTSLGLTKQDHILFEKFLNSLKKDNKKTANRYATKLSEIRKTIKFLYQVQMGIERFVMQLESKLEIGPINEKCNRKPASLGLRSMCKELSKILPDVSNELEKVCAIVEGNLVVFGFKNENAVLGLAENPETDKGVLCGN